ncbi:hypothetical protein BGZ61DRAFT_227036 [Ilyonectria robusta]|uniref:uncharacterized protein n=1 Tax=Ilyonectria robusta TaxID=1079257 RepID=UPI001E8ED600|nr:uncharacterized protein BGZ61DRAFT_227036 [Ilyonectria robusta]KAH8706776.1 hypothetical protein BGZ61DRAFT_227036 [Ilyonectria robusta]
MIPTEAVDQMKQQYPPRTPIAIELMQPKILTTGGKSHAEHCCCSLDGVRCSCWTYFREEEFATRGRLATMEPSVLLRTGM